MMYNLHKSIRLGQPRPQAVQYVGCRAIGKLSWLYTESLVGVVVQVALLSAKLWRSVVGSCVYMAKFDVSGLANPKSINVKFTRRCRRCYQSRQNS